MNRGGGACPGTSGHPGPPPPGGDQFQLACHHAFNSACRHAQGTPFLGWSRTALSTFCKRALQWALQSTPSTSTDRGHRVQRPEGAFPSSLLTAAGRPLRSRLPLFPLHICRFASRSSNRIRLSRGLRAFWPFGLDPPHLPHCRIPQNHQFCITNLIIAYVLRGLIS